MARELAVVDAVLLHRVDRAHGECEQLLTLSARDDRLDARRHRDAFERNVADRDVAHERERVLRVVLHHTDTQSHSRSARRAAHQHTRLLCSYRTLVDAEETRRASEHEALCVHCDALHAHEREVVTPVRVHEVDARVVG